MFIFENLVNGYRNRISEWEEARDNWCNAGDYRYPRDYEERHPKPGYYVTVGLRAVAIFIASFIAISFLTGVVNNSIETDKKTQIEENRVLQGKNCKAFNKNDHVQITGGNYSDGSGVIVGGCDKDNKYQVKLDKGSKADLPADGQDEVDVSGKIVEVSSKKDMAVIQLPEDKKE